MEQLPVVPPDRYDATRFGPKTAGEIVREAVLELTYTAHDMAPFARDMGYLDADGDVLLPFAWDEERRLHLRAKPDAVFFHLYGVNDRDDVRYVYSTFPIVEREETAAYGTYRSRDLCLAWMNVVRRAIVTPQYQATSIVYRADRRRTRAPINTRPMIPFCLNCCSARRLDADRRGNVLIPFDSEGPNDDA